LDQHSNLLGGSGLEQIGLESEYCRILIDQRWIGLGDWLAVLFCSSAIPIRATGETLRDWVIAMYGLGLPWAMGFIGTGITSSIPSTS
jgi:hypothetical protein